MNSELRADAAAPAEMRLPALGAACLNHWRVRLLPLSLVSDDRFSLS